MLYVFPLFKSAPQGRTHLQPSCHAAVCQLRGDCRHDCLPGDCRGRWLKEFHYYGSFAVLCALSVVCLLLVRKRGLRTGDESTSTSKELLSLIDFFTQSKTLSTSGFGCSWHTFDGKCKRILLIFMINTERPFLFTAGGFMGLTLPSFTYIISKSYSIVAVLRQMYSRA